MRWAVCPIKRRPDYLRVAARGRKVATPGLVLQACRRSSRTSPLRVGLTASRRVGGAVQRNRARRRLREAVARVMPLHAAAGHDYVVIARAASVRRPFPALAHDLEIALKRLDLWRND